MTTLQQLKEEALKKIPKRIYLQLFDEDGEELLEPSFSIERIEENDIEYILKEDIEDTPNERNVGIIR